METARLLTGIAAVVLIALLVIATRRSKGARGRAPADQATARHTRDRREDGPEDDQFGDGGAD